MARRNSSAMVTVGARLIRALEAAGELNRAIEFLPTDREIVAREAAGEGFTSPEQAVMAAYAKITLTAHITDSTLPDEPWFQTRPAGVFPGTDRRAVPRRPPDPPAASRDHQHLRRQRPGQPGRDQLRPSSGRRDRRRHRSGDPGLLDRPRRVRARLALGRHRGARQPGADDRSVRRLPRDPAAARPGHPLAGRRALPDHRRRGRGGPVRRDRPNPVAEGDRPAVRRRARDAVFRGRPVGRPGSAAGAVVADQRTAQRLPAAGTSSRSRPPAIARPKRSPNCISRCPSGSASITC